MLAWAGATKEGLEIMRKSVRRLGLGVAFALLPLAMPVMAASITGWENFNYTGTFSNVGADNSGFATEVAPNLSVLVTMTDASTAAFTFSYADSPTDHDGVITRIYWDATVPQILGNFAVGGLPTNWATPANPSTMPEGNIVTVESSKSSGASSNGIDDGESATFLISLLPTYNWSHLLTELSENDLRMGVFVSSIDPGGSSDHFVSSFPAPPSDPPPPPPPLDNVVPVPGAAGLGLVGMAIVAKLRKKGAKTA